MERPNQPPGTECCRGEGKVPSPSEGEVHRTTPWKRTQEETQAASASRTALKQFSLDTYKNADGEGVNSPEPKTTGTAQGEVSEGLPGSIERGERDKNQSGTWDVLGSPGGANYENQPGRQAQTKQELSKDPKEIRLAHSSQEQDGPQGS